MPYRPVIGMLIAVLYAGLPAATRGRSLVSTRQSEVTIEAKDTMVKCGREPRTLAFTFKLIVRETSTPETEFNDQSQLSPNETLK